jgi:hypothetical protein
LTIVRVYQGVGLVTPVVVVLNCAHEIIIQDLGALGQPLGIVEIHGLAQIDYLFDETSFKFG